MIIPDQTETLSEDWEQWIDWSALSSSWIVYEDEVNFSDPLDVDSSWGSDIVEDNVCLTDRPLELSPKVASSSKAHVFVDGSWTRHNPAGVTRAQSSDDVQQCPTPGPLLADSVCSSELAQPVPTTEARPTYAQVAARAQLVVGIDFGTTFSGVAFAYAQHGSGARSVIDIDYGTTYNGIPWSSSSWGTGQNSYDDAYLRRQPLDRLRNHSTCALASSTSRHHYHGSSPVWRESEWRRFPCRGPYGPSSGHHNEVPGRNHSGWGGIAASNGSNIYGLVKRVKSLLRPKSGPFPVRDG